MCSFSLCCIWGCKYAFYKADKLHKIILYTKSSPGESQRLFLAMRSYGLQVLLAGMSVAFHGLPCNFGKFGSRRLFVLTSVSSKPRHFVFLIVGEFLTFILVLRIVDSQALQTLLRALRTLCFPGLNFGKVSTVMIFLPWILRLLYSASAVEHFKLLSYDLHFPLSCRYFGFKNSPVKIKLS